MRKKILLGLALLISFTNSQLYAEAKESKDVASVSLSTASVTVGASFELPVTLQIQKDWHLNGHENLPEYFIPLEVSIANPNIPFTVLYPKGKTKKLGGSSKSFPVYEGEIVLVIKVDANNAKAGKFNVPLSIKLQACNDNLCLAPSDISKTISVVYDPGKSVSETASASSLDENNIISKFLKEKGTWITFLLIFLGGLALNLTPCVYPMIPLTVSYFGSQKTEKPLTILGRALAYVLGLSVTYTTLGVTAALTGKLFGSALQSPFVLMGISLLLVILSFSMFGLYEIQAPSWLLNKVSNNKASGWLGALVMGLVFGVVAAPCVDPFSIGLLTYVASKADPLLGFSMFFTLSLGLGFPYIWLGFFSNKIQTLPKSGLWMVWVKKVFGFILLGMPFYFLNPLLPKTFSSLLLPIYIIVSGFLLGFVFSGKSVSKPFHLFQKFLGALVMMAGLLVLTLKPQVQKLPFQAYSPALLVEAKNNKQNVFMDFTADWCAPCRELEAKTFSKAKVHDALKDWMLLKVDLTQSDSEEVKRLRSQYQIRGVPTLMLIRKNGEEAVEHRTIGFIEADDLVRKIKETEEK